MGSRLKIEHIRFFIKTLRVTEEHFGPNGLLFLFGANFIALNILFKGATVFAFILYPFPNSVKAHIFSLGERIITVNSKTDNYFTVTVG